MRKALLLLFFAGLIESGMGQGFTFHCTRDTAIGCSLNCFTLKALIPDLHGLTTSYNINPLSTTNACYNPQVDPTVIGTTIINPVDDKYTQPLNISFPFPFYGQTYTQILASTNGYTCFDLTRAGLSSHWQICQSGGVLNGTGTPLDLPSNLYDKGLIMGPYHDLYPVGSTSPNMYMKYDTIGVAPYRKWVLSFYKIPLFSCTGLVNNTNQIALYESTGIVEIYIAEQQICLGWNEGRAMVGMQDMARTSAIMAPGRKASDPPWGTAPMAESWRFVPSAGPSLFKRVELYSLSGTLLSVGDTAAYGNGTLEATFLNVCPNNNSTTSFVVKSFYKKIDDTTQEIMGIDTINVIRNAGVINATTTSASCATGLGSVTVTTPVGPTLEYSIDNGVTWQSSNVFLNVTTGSHVVIARIVGTTCSSSTTVVISAVNTLNASYSTVDAACNGSASGSIIVAPTSGGTPPYMYSLDGGPYQVSDTFVSVPSGNHTITVRDAGQCTFTINNVFVANGGGIAIQSVVETNATCQGAANGTIHVTPANGVAPFTYSINGGPFLANGGLFTGLAAGNYSIIVKDASGCTATVNKTVGTDNGGFTASAVTTNSGCTPSGTITVTPDPPATGPFTYSLDGGPQQSGGGSSYTFTGVSGGTHTVIVTQGGACTFPVTVVVGTNASMTATADSTNAECSGALTGTINVTASNGVAPYQYKIDGGTFQPSGLFTGLAAGPHTITVQDNSGCIYSFIKIVGTGSGITATASATNTACSNAFNGTITVTPQSGISPYLYNIDGGVFQGSNFFTGLSAGSHTIVVKDSAGCVYSFTQIIIASAGVTGTATSTNTACTGASTGTITVTGQSGILPYQFNINGGPYQASNLFSGLAAGTYTLTVKDSVGCVGTVVQIVTASQGLTVTATTTNTACANATTGSISVQANGVAPYTYNIDGGAFQGSGVFTGLAAGSHTIIVHDAVGCSATFIQAIVASAGVSGTATSTNTACTGASTGTITVNAQNGILPYFYNINGGAYQPSNLFSGLAAGTYTLTVRDSAGCVGTVIQTITASQGLTATATTTNTACTGAATGSISVLATGFAPYTYNIDGGAFQGSNTFNGLAAGPHTIIVHDAVGCSTTFVQAILANPGVSGTATSTNTACTGASTGTITVTGQSGILPYLYNISGGAYQPSNLFSGLAAGTYTLTVKDAAGCVGTTVQVVTASQGLTATATTTNTACTGISTGTITVQANGIAPYTYNIDGGAFQGSPLFSGLSAGGHTIIVHDAVGCSYTFLQSIVASQGVTAGVATTNSACGSASTGSITVTPTAGSAPFTYSLDGLPPVATNVFNGLAQGLHTVLVKDAVGCTLLVSAPIASNPGVTATADSLNTACALATTGGLVIYPTAGVSPYLFKIDAGAYQGSNIFNGLAAGIHTITVKDAAGCIFTFTKTILANAGVTATPTIGNAGCPGSNTGVIQVNPINGISPYKYSLNGAAFQVSNTFTNLAAGTYNIVVKDSAGCTFPLSVTVGTNPLVTAQLTVIPPSCFSTATGSITILPSLGTSPYQYALNAGGFQAVPSFTNLIAGNYTVHVKDATNCTFDTAITISQPALFRVKADTVAATCNGNDGQINITAIGGTSPYLYSVNGGATYVSNSLIADSAGTYAIRIKDAMGCTADTVATVSLVNTMFLSLSQDTTVCSGSTVAFTPTTNPQTNIFNWSPSGGTLNPATGAYSVQPTDTTLYTLTAKWGVCQMTVSGTVNVLQKPIVNAGADTIICDQTFAVLHGSASHLSGPITYMWSPATDIISPDTSNTPTTVVHPLTRGQHVYTLEVDDQYGCNFKVTDQVIVTMNPPVPAFAGRDTIAAMDLPHQLFGSGGVSYLWTPPNLLDNPTKKNPIAILHSDTRFILTVIDNGGCVGSDTVNIKVYKGPTYYIPNAFSPNGDGINDVFRAIPPGISSTEYFRVFNRWGQMIFETHDYLKGWDGTYIGKPQPAGAYVWIIKGTDKYGKPVEMRGTVMLIR